ncbi:MAG: chromosome segregation protein SMC [Thermoplasmata archaeon]|jgi:chromosome segregation protein|nr:chromosome segregation protein SMC [Thermoplasmatales archaeon]
MYLKSLEMENFKSFGRKTIIEFKKGFTAVSGPNGSGKSNISDAILFVLGPKSSKVLRAQRLTDLIFNGGKERKPADYCKVTLTFDNSDREIPVDSDEVSFTRVVRKSENEEDYNSYFYINGEKAKLQDFTALLSKAKIFADGYNIVQQGDVTRIVEMSPFERRRILEEISGITKYDEQILDAQKKKEETEENIGKIEVLINEIEERLKNLENDRKVALRYLELKKELQESKAKLEYKKIQQIKGEIEGDEREINNIMKQIDDVKKGILELENRRQEMLQELENVNRDISKLGTEEQVKLKASMDDLRLEIGRQKMKIEDLQARVEEIVNEIKSLEVQRKSIARELEEKLKKRNESSKRLSTLENEINAMKNDLTKLEESISSSSREMRDLQNFILERQKDLTREREIVASLKTELNAKNEASGKIDIEIASLEEEIKSIELNIKDAEWRLSEIKKNDQESRKKSKDMQDLYYSLKNREAELRNEIQNLEAKILSLTRSYEKSKARVESNKNMEAIYFLLEARDKGIIRGIRGTVRELIRYPDELSLAVDVAGGNRLDSIVVDNDDVAEVCIDYLKQNKKGIATFLPINKMVPGRPRGKALLATKDEKCIGLVLEKISYDKEIEGPLWYVFGDTVIVQDLGTARRLMGGVRIVTLDGQLIEASGAITGGLVQRNERSQLLGDMDGISRELRSAMERKDSLLHEYNEIIKKLDDVSKILQDFSSKRFEDPSVYERVIKENREKLQKLNDNLKKKYAERDSLTSRLKELEDRLKVELEKLEFIEKDYNSATIRMSENAPEELQNKLRFIKNELENKNKEYGTLNLILKDLDHEIDTHRKTLQNIEITLEKLKNEKSQKEADIGQFSSKLKENEEKLRKFQEINSSFEASIKKKLEERDRINSSIVDIENSIQRANEEINRKNDFIITLKTRINENRKTLEDLERDFSLYGIEVKDPVEPVAELKKKIEYCETTMLSLEPVNMKSIEEYDYESKRMEELKNDYAKLMEEKRNLISLMNELSIKKKEGLLGVYRSIRENFSRIYSEITNGGEALMYLENEEDPFAGGLVIKARPKGKKMIRLEALSGGEKSLTALTFILAIQQYDPSPFYLFDESDMFLDAWNAENIARVLKENSKNAQFIVVSLRKTVLKYADHMIGVTITPEGISKVLEETYVEEAKSYGQ